MRVVETDVVCDNIAIQFTLHAAYIKFVFYLWMPMCNFPFSKMNELRVCVVVRQSGVGMPHQHHHLDHKKRYIEIGGYQSGHFSPL
jgi:hypothetical protein